MSGRVTRLGRGIALLSACLALGGARPSWAAVDMGLRRCTQLTVVSDADGGSETLSDLSDSPSIICSVDFTPTSNAGFVRLVDSPTDDITHGQAVTVGEASAATAANSAHAYYGELGRLTQFGLEAEVYRGVAIIHWDN